jgi:hypothetical protein
VDRSLPGVEDVRSDRLVLPGSLERFHFPAGDEVDGGVVLVDPDPAMGAGAGEENAFHLPAGQVLGVEDPPLRVPPLASEVELLPPLQAGEPDSPLDQFPDLRGGVAHDEVDHVGVAEPCPRPVRVLDVGFERILAAPHGGDAALRVVRAGLEGLFFRNDGHRSLAGRAKGETEACNAASDDQELGAPFHPLPPAGSRAD